MSRRSISINKSSATHSVNKIHQTKSQYADDVHKQATPLCQWYINKCKQINKSIPLSLTIHQRSQPFKLTINKLSGLNVSKNGNVQYLRVLAQFMTKQLDMIGKTSVFQCLDPISQSKFQEPVSYYYHSNIDRNSQMFKMVLTFQIVEMKGNIVENIVDIGVAVIDKPLLEETVKNAPIFRQCSIIQLVSSTSSSSFSASPTTFTYNIVSKLQLKNLTKLVPKNMILSTQDEITGVLNSFLPNDQEDCIFQQQQCLIKINAFQIHIPQKFQLDCIEAIKQLKIVSGHPKINQRKIICGFHNQYHFVSPIQRKLNFREREATGQWNINIYQVISNEEIIKIPYYLVEKQSIRLCTFGVSLVYEIDGCSLDMEVCMYCMTPSLEGEVNQISEKMIIGPGQGLHSCLIGINTKKVPTIVLQYGSEQLVSGRSRITDQHISANIIKSQYKLPMKSSKKIVTQQDIRMQQRMMEEVQHERMLLERQKQELEKLKTHHYSNYQEDFDKKLEAQRQELWNRQRAIEQQYREQVEQEIRNKVQLEREIMEMKEKLMLIEENPLAFNERRISVERTPPLMQLSDNRFPNDSVATGGFNNFSMRQKVNPGYLLQQQKTVPVNQVRDIMSQAFQKNKQIIQKQCSMFNCASKFTFHLSSVIWSSQLETPKSIFIILKFFNFSEFRTDVISYIQSDSEHHQLIKLHHYTYGYEDIHPIYSFTVDPSEYSSPQIIQQDLTHYLCKNNAILDIFDAQTHIYIGQINIKLADLLRGSKSQVLVAKEYNIVRVKNQQNYGVMQLLIKNEMQECKQTVSLTERKRQRDLKKKVVSNSPLVIINDPKISHDTHSKIKSSSLINNSTTKNRQQKRIQSYKKKIQESKKKSGISFERLSDPQKGQMINKIHEYKQKKMPEYIQKLYQKILTEKITINPQLGQSKTFVYEFTNISNSPGSFKVSIQGNYNEEKNHALTLVKHSTQWKHYVSKNQYQAPKVYECISDENSFYLGAGQSIPLLFKYLAFPHGEASVDKSQLFSVSVVKQESNWIVGGFSLTIEPHQSLINHSYVLYQPGDHVVDIILPVIYSTSDTRIPKHLFVTSPQAEAQWLNQYEILLKIQTPEIMNKIKFNLLLYEDEFFDQLRQNWLIDVYAYEGICTISRPEEKTKFKICLPADVATPYSRRKLRLNSSHPDLVFEQDEIDSSKLDKTGPLEIWCQLLPNSLATQIQITCTDNLCELVYGWIVQIFSYSPKRA